MRMGTGSVYRRKVRKCLTCGSTKHPKKCEATGHEIAKEPIVYPIWWIRYSHEGKSYFESTEKTKKSEAIAILNERLGEISKGTPPPKKTKFTFDDATTDLTNDYKMHKRRSLKTLNLRLEKHLKPFFKERLMAAITTADVRAYAVTRQEQGASNGTINRELTALKRMFTLAVRAKKIPHAPFIELLKENNARKGFFEPEQFESVKNHLPAHMKPVAAFAYITGWRTPSEVLPLEWRHVDFAAGEVRLDPGVTKNDEPRVFPFTKELRRVLDEQRAAADQLQREKSIITPYVFFFPEGGKFGGRDLKTGRQITESGYNKAWVDARTVAGCPGRIPHDFRRTAVRNFDRLNVSRSTAMKLTGHKTEAVYRRYAIVSSEDLRDAARRLDGAGVTVSCYSNGNSDRSKERAAQNS